MHDHAHHHSGQSVANLRLAFVLNAGFAVLEIFGGLLTNSVAILSDALHDVGDALALGMAWQLQRISERPAAGRFTYGFARLSLLAALINALILVVGSLFILSEALPRLLAPEPTHAAGMIGFAVLGVAINGYAAWRLHGGDTLNSKVASWHLIEDCLGWAAVLVVGVVLLFTDLFILDPILSVLVTAFVLYNVQKNLRRTGSLFLQAVPEGVEALAVEERLLSVDGVRECHSTHLWSLDGEKHVLSTHLVLDEDVDVEAVRRIKQRSRERLHDFGFEHITLEIEFGREDCSMQHGHPTGAGAV